MTEEDVISYLENIENIINTYYEPIIDIYDLCSILLSYIEQCDSCSFINQEEYKEYLLYINKEAIDIVKVTKKMMFKSMLDSYNEFLDIKYDTLQYFNEKEKFYKKLLDRSNKNKKLSIFTILTGLTFFPDISIYIALLNIPLLSIDSYVENKTYKQLEKLKIIKEKYAKLQDEFFEITDSVRTDYFETKKVLKKLEKVDNRYIIDELMELVTINEQDLVKKNKKKKNLVKKKE